MYPRGSATNASVDQGVVRTRTAWNERFEHWERPASDSEEVKIERAARMVRDALDGRDFLGLKHVQVIGQGSYFNNTNTRLESDMDLRVDWRDTCLLVADKGMAFDQAQAALKLVSTSNDVSDVAAHHRVRVWLALSDAFGADQVVPGNKSLKLKSIPNSRAPADVVPTIRCLYAVPSGAGLLSLYPREVEGVAIYDRDGGRTINFPALHHENGKQKHADTLRRFKKLVRIQKCLRDELIELGYLRKGQVPSFLIECLVYAAPNWAFLVDEDRYDRVRRVLVEMADLLRHPLRCLATTEINGIKPLFGAFLGQQQPWTPDDARAFIAAAWTRLEA